jgi:hypothetical protein
MLHMVLQTESQHVQRMQQVQVHQTFEPAFSGIGSIFGHIPLLLALWNAPQLMCATGLISSQLKP